MAALKTAAGFVGFAALTVVVMVGPVVAIVTYAAWMDGRL